MTANAEPVLLVLTRTPHTFPQFPSEVRVSTKLRDLGVGSGEF